MNDADDAVYGSRVFLLHEDGGFEPLAHALYVALGRGEARCPQWAGQRLRVADWYVRLRGGQPEALVSEWYGWVRFRADGSFDPAPHGGPPEAGPRPPQNIDEDALPTEAEREALRRAVFGGGG